MGYDDRTIADTLGQRTIAMAQHYSNRANCSRKLLRSGRKLCGRDERTADRNCQTLKEEQKYTNINNKLNHTVAVCRIPVKERSG